MGASRRIDALVGPALSPPRPIPPLAWIPLAIVWLGLGDAAKMMVIFFAAFVPSVINSYTGVRQIDKPIFEAAAMLGRPRLALLARGADPRRAAEHLHWAAAVAAGLVDHAGGRRAGGRGGRAGHDPEQASQDIYPAMILVGMISVALCGWPMTLGLGWIERRVHALEGPLMLAPPLRAAGPLLATLGCRRRQLPCAVDAGRAVGHRLARVPAHAAGTWSSASPSC